jgi:hypothetical protein
LKVHQLITRDDGLTNPKRSVWGVTFALRWGDVCHPLGQGDWFKPPYFSRVLRFWSYFPLPFVAWNLWGWRGYLGAKVYGVDSPAYKNWIAPDEVYEGSQAIQFSGRLKISD